ncbi:hypothetical protein HDE_04794 [Halotydeus destructor]|nr:hypothetical protein HDE_04794 [Halotydeus destructor]
MDTFTITKRTFWVLLLVQIGLLTIGATWDNEGHWKALGWIKFALSFGLTVLGVAGIHRQNGRFIWLFSTGSAILLMLASIGKPSVIGVAQIIVLVLLILTSAIFAWTIGKNQ